MEIKIYWGDSIIVIKLGASTRTKLKLVVAYEGVQVKVGNSTAKGLEPIKYVSS